MSDLDQRLSAMFRNINTRADFDARLFERLRVEAAEDTEERARRVLQIEQRRYRIAQRELSSWRRWKESISGVVTLDTIGVGALAAGLVASTWSLDQIREAVPVLFTAVGILAAVSPVIMPLVLRQMRVLR